MTQLLERAPEADASALDHVNHWIDGQRVAGTSGRSGPVYDPATGRLAQCLRRLANLERKGFHQQPI